MIISLYFFALEMQSISIALKLAPSEFWTFTTKSMSISQSLTTFEALDSEAHVLYWTKLICNLVFLTSNYFALRKHPLIPSSFTKFQTPLPSLSSNFLNCLYLINIQSTVRKINGCHLTTNLSLFASPTPTHTLYFIVAAVLKNQRKKYIWYVVCAQMTVTLTFVIFV